MKHIFLIVLVAILSCATGFAQGGYNPESPGDPSPYRKLTVSASPKVGGSVDLDNESQVGVGQTVDCYASENAYYEFVHWLQNGEIVSTDNQYTFVMPDEDVELVAVFELDYSPQNPGDPQDVNSIHRVVLSASPGTGGYFRSSVLKLAEGESVDVYAYPNSNFDFVGWMLDGVTVSTENPLTIEMADKDLNYVACFSYEPSNPADPSANFFNPVTGEMVIDKFESGRLSSAIYALLGDDYKCSDITSLTVVGSMTVIDLGIMNLLSNCSSIDLSNTSGYTEISSYAFESLGSLEKILLPTCISSIGSFAFSGCTNLSEITCGASKPPYLYDSSSFDDNHYENAILYVPSTSISSYANSTYAWSKFKNIQSSKVFTAIVSPEVSNEVYVSPIIYTLDGVQVLGDARNLNPGIYLIKQGSKSHKVVVK